MQLAGKSKKPPRELAEEIKNKIELSDDFKKVEVAGPGYLNFFLSNEYIFKRLFREGETQSEEKRETSFLIEHSSPNLFKPFHIGHMVNNAIGESLKRILAFSNEEVKSVSFPSDVSPGIAKTI